MSGDYAWYEWMEKSEEIVVDEWDIIMPIYRDYTYAEQ